MSDTEPNIEAPVVSNETHVEAPAASEAPAATSEAPAATSEAPAATTEAPAATSEAPAATTEAPASTTEVPASSNEVPVTTSEAPVASEIAAVNAPAAVEVAPPTPSPAPQPSPSTNWPGKGTLWVTEPTAELPIRVAPSGPGSEQPMIVHEALQEIVKKLGNEGALHWKPNKETKNWVIWTWKQYYDDSMKFAKSLLKLGLQAHECVSIIGFNSPHWLIADVGTILAGGIAAGIYTTNGPEACHYIADHSKSVVVVVENEAHLKKFLQIRGNLPHLKAIVMWTGNVPEGQTGVYSWEQFMQLGQEVEDEKVHERIRNQKPGHCCTLIYTSGTTGPPKAVMISQDSVVWTGRIVAKMLQISGNDHIISYLPLSHIAAQMTDVHAPMCTGMKVYFAFPDALKGSLGNTMKEVRPTFLLGVPRVWEKIEEKMKQVGAQTKGLKKSIANWAKEIGLEGNYNIQKGQSTPWGWWMANALVFSKIREALGLDRCRMAATAAAPIAKETLDYFLSLNIPIYEIYGMSECTGPQTINIPGKHKTGSAGPALPGTEMVIDKPDAEGAGEIIYRGRHIFMGYMYNDKATAETVDDKGFLHSGDIGKIDKDGFLSITGRIKELIITAGGENIPPVLIEDEIKKEMPKVLSNIMVIGDRKKFLSCVVTLKCEPIPAAKDGQYAFTDNLAPDCKAELAAAGATATTIQEAIADPKVQAYITAGIGRANKRATSNAQCVQKFVILPKDFSIDGDELTPTLKLKRRIVVQKYEKEIEKMYEEAPGSQQ